MAFDQGHALIVGVRSHKFSHENDVEITFRDAEAVRKILIDPKKCGYPEDQVTFLHDDTATALGISKALDELAKRINPSETLFFFFAGHGAFGTDDNYYLATHEVKFADTNEGELRIEAGTGLNQVELVKKIKAIKAKRVLLIFNACHSGSLHPQALGVPKKPSGKSLPAVTASALLGTGEGRIVISACRPDQLSNFYNESDLTFFVKALTEGLKGKATPSHGYVSAFNLYTYVYEAVSKVAKKAKVEQEPMITVTQGIGPFPVALAPQSAKSLAPTAAEKLPESAPVLRVSKKESQKWLQKIETQVIVMGDYVVGDNVARDKIGQQINTDGGAFIGGSVTVGGNFAGRDQYNYSSIAPATLGGTTLSQRLIGILADNFNMAELQDICDLLGIEWSHLPGRTSASKAKGLVEACEEQGLLKKLSATVGLAKPEFKGQLK